MTCVYIVSYISYICINQYHRYIIIYVRANLNFYYITRDNSYSQKNTLTKPILISISQKVSIKPIRLQELPMR